MGVFIDIFWGNNYNTDWNKACNCKYLKYKNCDCKSWLQIRNFVIYLFLLQDKKKVTKIVEQLTVAHHSTMVEQLLVKYNIALPRYVKQAELIGLLISDLYTDVPELVDTPGD